MAILPPPRPYVQNTDVRFKPVNDAVSALGRVMAEKRERENMAALGKAAQGGNLAKARDLAMSEGYLQQGMAFDNRIEQRNARAASQARANAQAEESRRRFDLQMQQSQRQFDATHGLNRERLDLQKQRASQPSNMTPQMKNFMAAQKNPEFGDFMERMKRAGAHSVNIKGDTELAKGFAKKFFELQDRAESAEGAIALYDIAEQALNTGVRTGALGETENNVRRFAALIGVGDAEKLKGGELITAVQNRLALNMRNPASGMGMPGAVSDRDIKFLKDSQPGLDRSPQSNAFMIEAFRRIERRKIEVANMAVQYIENNKRLDAGFVRQVRQFAKNNPLFAGMQVPGKMAPGSPANSEPSTAPGQRILKFDPQTQRIIE